MAVSDKNHRRYVTFPKDLERLLEELAEKDNRTFNNYIITVLKRHTEQLDNKIHIDIDKPHS